MSDERKPTAAERDAGLAVRAVAIALGYAGLLRRDFDKLHRLMLRDMEHGDVEQDETDGLLEKIKEHEGQAAVALVDAAIAVGRAVRADKVEQQLRGRS